MATDILHEMISEFFSLLTTCWNSNFCKFEYHFFDFPPEIGIPIGSPLSSFPSKVFKDKLEKVFFFLPRSPGPLIDTDTSITFCAFRMVFVMIRLLFYILSMPFTPPLLSRWSMEGTRLFSLISPFTLIRGGGIGSRYIGNPHRPQT